MDPARWRHWGGSDLWRCREHPYYLGETFPEDTPRRYRTTEVFEAAEHATLQRHGLVNEARDLELPLQASSLSEYVAMNAERLDSLDRLAPELVSIPHPRTEAPRFLPSSPPVTGRPD
jgi:hypothetical protein